MKRFLISIFIIFTLLTVTIPTATAEPATVAPVYFARAGASDSVQLPLGDQKEDSESVAVDIISPLFQDYFTVFHSGEGHAAAGPFGVKAGGGGTVHVVTSPTNPNNFIPPTFFQNGEGFAVMTLGDVVISGPGDTVPASLNLSVRGSMEASAHVSGTFIGQARASSSATLDVSVNGNLFHGTIIRRQAMNTDGQIDQSIEQTGLFNGFSGSGLISTGVVDLPVNTPLFLEIKLQAGGTSFFQVGGVACCDPPRIDANSNADFTHTVTFPGSGAVFNLPVGYTVNAPSVGIVDNRWTLGGTAPDTTAPEIACGSPDGVWHATDVSIHCTASDDGSGLANADDASFSLTTFVSDGTETADAQTDSRLVCDVAGNCASAGPIGGNKVDKKAPTIGINAPADGASYLLGQTVTADYDCQDGGSGIALCAGPAANGSAIDTSLVGVGTFAVDSQDAVGNMNHRSVGYTVAYAVCALYDQAKVNKLGSTVPIKLQLCDAMDHNVSSPAVVLHATGLIRLSDNVSWAVEDSGNANPGNDFRYDDILGGTGGFILNLSTKGLSSGAWMLNFTVTSDSTLHSVQFQVR